MGALGFPAVEELDCTTPNLNKPDIIKKVPVSRPSFANLRSYACPGRGGGQPPNRSGPSGLVHIMTL